MPRIASFRLSALELPFRKPFKHAAAARTTSSSLFLECELENGTIGFGEALPREYVTGETAAGAFELLAGSILPRLIGHELEHLGETRAFLTRCDGKAPASWIPAETPQLAAWSAVDLALLDASGKACNRPAIDAPTVLPGRLAYSGVMSADSGTSFVKSCLKFRLFGFRAVKLKVDEQVGIRSLEKLRRLLGPRVDVRADANMAWSADEAVRNMGEMSKYGVRSFEQPLAADDIEGAARVVRETGLGVMADESFTDRESLSRLIQARACTAVNVRISKNGGVTAALARCREALAAGLIVQIGCQVGETSLMSAAHLGLVASVPETTYAEGCFGRFLLREDPVIPLLQFGPGGRPPLRPRGPGFGVTLDRESLTRHTRRTVTIPAA